MRKKKNNGSYLSQLTFKKQFESSFIYKYLTNIRYVALILMAIIPFGVMSFLNLPRRLNPEISLPYVSVTTTLPGASPEEVEQLITIPIEDAVENTDDIVQIDSSSRESFSQIQIEFSNKIKAEDAKQKVQDAVDSITDLPEDAGEPRVDTFDFENQPIITYALSRDDQDTISLQQQAQEFVDKLEDDKDIDKVAARGLETKSLDVLIKPEIAKTYNLSTLQVKSLISDSLNSFPAGTVNSGEFEFSITVPKETYSYTNIRELPINVNGVIVPLSFVAEIKEVPKDEVTTNFIKENGSFVPTVILDVYRNKQSDITVAVTKADEITTNLSKETNHLKVTTVSSAGKDIEKQFGDLFSNFAMTLVLVFVTLFLFLGIRQSTIVALSIPFTMLISFTVMSMAGLSLNFLTVFSLLIALGLLVDDAIVVVSALTSYYRTGKFTTNQAGYLVWKDFIIPIWSTTITTVWAFLPLLLSTGIIGEFIKTIPIVVSSTLIASTAVAVLLTLPITAQVLDLSVPRRVVLSLKIILPLVVVGIYLALVPKQPFWMFGLGLLFLASFLISLFFTKMRMPKWDFSVLKHGFIDSEGIAYRYKKILSKILSSKSMRRKVVVLVVVASIASYALLPLGFVKNEFFPKVNANVLYINQELPTGLKLERREQEAVRLATSIPEKKGISEIIVTSSNPVTITLKLNENEISSTKLAEELRNTYKQWTYGEVTVEEESGGPPVGSDLEVSILGDDLSELDRIANDIIALLKTNKDVFNVESSIKPSASRISFIPDRNKLLEHNISLSELGFSLRSAISGFDLDTIKYNGKDIDVVYSFSGKKLNSSALYTIEVQTQKGPIMLTELGKFITEANPDVVVRKNGKRRVTVSAGVSDSSKISEINKQVNDYIASDLKMPEGYGTETGGVNQENEKSVRSIMLAMVLSVILILGTMVLQLGSFRKSIIILLVIPLAVSGVFVLFAITGTPLSFPALIGVLALFGIVVNNSIVVVEKINQNLNAKLKFVEAIVDASASRVEPILFSSLTTIMGLLPITFTDPLWRGLGGAIIAGLSVSGITMLFFIPVIYYMWFLPNKKEA